MSDWEKANELMENLIRIYSPKLTQDEVHMLKSHMLSGKIIQMTLLRVIVAVIIVTKIERMIVGFQLRALVSWKFHPGTVDSQL